ncbi:hypothetical protein [Pelistega indica]|uniref:hypothetical protein n=1 Tax=Pelistega indica TaxID=1414851 RepID=UPI0021C4AFC4|nr:hypothetical protein [Pelistega indica]
MMKTLTAILLDNILRVAALAPLVIVQKMGATPGGFRMGNTVAKTNNKLLIKIDDIGLF